MVIGIMTTLTLFSRIEIKEELGKENIMETIDKIKFIIRDNVESEIIMQDVAAEYNLGYSYFRKMVKKYTGVSPKQYHLQLKIMRAKELLISTDKSVKEVCFDLRFQSTSYFSRIFKQKMGITPVPIKEEMESYFVLCEIMIPDRNQE